MKTLTFDGQKGAKRFELCFAALSLAGDGKGERNAVTVRKEARLFNALDSVSVDTQPLTPDKQPRTLQAGGGSLELQDDDWKLLLHYVETCPWAPKVAREAVDVMDFVIAAGEPTPHLKVLK